MTGGLYQGMLRLKKHKETESRRVLLRNSGTGKIIIVSPILLISLSTGINISQNFKIYPGLNPSMSGKVVTFVGHDDTGLSATYRVRVPTEQDAIEFKSALDSEISAVKD